MKLGNLKGRAQAETELSSTNQKSPLKQVAVLGSNEDYSDKAFFYY